jgi:anti-sigma B factor antagonist
MSIQKEPLPGEIWLIGVSGRLDQNQSLELEITMQELVDEGYFNLLIDLSEVNYINSGGLRCLVTLWRQTRQHGGNLALCGLNSRLTEVFSIVGFDKVFDIYDDCSSFQSS